jgi:NADPH-dependent 7-cyano-7-deazaguanine reductase QueF
MSEGWEKIVGGKMEFVPEPERSSVAPLHTLTPSALRSSCPRTIQPSGASPVTLV